MESKRKRATTRKRDVKGNIFWSDEMTSELLRFIKEHMDIFERPTSQIFYKQLSQMVPILGNIEWARMRQKMRNLKCQYARAKAWQQKLGVDLKDSDQYVKATVAKMCPFWSELEYIFENNHLIMQISSCESNESFDESPTPKNFMTEVIKQEADMTEMFKISNVHCVLECSNDAPERHTPSEDEDTIVESNPPKRQKINEFVSVSVQTDELTLEERNIELKELEKKHEREIKLLQYKIQEEELNYKKSHLTKKYELINTIISGQIRLRELEIEKDERIKRLEMELKYKMLQK